MITLLCVCLLPLAGHANNEGACKRYATEAVRQNSQNMALQAGFGGPAWSSNYNAHYNWILHGRNIDSSPHHLADREAKLQQHAVEHGYQPAGSGMVVTTPIAVQPAVNGGAGATSGSTASTSPMIIGQVTGIAKIDKDEPVKPPAIKLGNIAGGDLNAVSSLRNARALIESRINRSGFNPLKPAENPIFDIPAGKPNQTVHIGRGYNSLLKQSELPGIAPPAWSADQLAHEAWCRMESTSQYAADQETTNRQVHLDKHLKSGQISAPGHETGNGAAGTGTFFPIQSLPTPQKALSVIATKQPATSKSEPKSYKLICRGALNKGFDIRIDSTQFVYCTSGSFAAKRMTRAESIIGGGTLSMILCISSMLQTVGLYIEKG